MSARPQTLREETFLLMRSAERSGGGSVLIVAPSAHEPSAESVARLQRAFRLRHEIDPAWGTKPIAVTVHEGRPALLLEDPGGVMLESLLGRLTLDELLSAALAVTEAVRMLHDSGLVHRDLKPQNVLLERASSRAWLTGLCLAERSEQVTTLDGTAPLSGTLAYMAPEQTGRVRAAVDARSDLYSLGVTLYQLATGALPFAAREPMEWVHSHVARRPIPPLSLTGELPEQVQRILLKLLEKEPQARYQTAAGLAYDLRACLEERRTSGSISVFPLASRDTPGHLLERPRFHGRAEELVTLSAAFERVQRKGAPELVLISASSGMGKTALAREFLRRCLPAGTLVASGKVDDVGGDASYGPLLQAFRELTRWLLAKGAEELVGWVDALRAALGPNAAIVTQLVPELEVLLGSQPSLPVLFAEEARNRVYLTLRQFLRLFANRQRVVALFLDDLQWLDAATTELLERLLLDPELENLLVIGAERRPSENALIAASWERLRASGRSVTELSLGPLELASVRRVVADSIFAMPESSDALSQVVERKTGGNPFFVRQFLAVLVEDDLLRFDVRARTWTWDLPGILAKGHTENLAELVLSRIGRLPAATQRALQTLGCLSGETNAQLLGALHGITPGALRQCLQPAVEAQVVTSIHDRYAFRHDRLKEAAYGLMPEAERPARHLAIGKLLATRSEGTSDGVFEVVRHLNRGVGLLEEPAERRELAELNLAAAKRAMENAAAPSALSLLELASSLLPSRSWQEQPELSFAIGLARAECEFLCGDRARAAELLTELSAHSQDPVALASVVCAQISLYITEQRMEEACEVGTSYLARFASSWPQQVNERTVAQQHVLLEAARAGRDVASLAHLPALRSEAIRATLDVCASLVSPAYFAEQNLFRLLVLYMATLSLEHGNCDSSCLAYMLLCFVLGPVFGQHPLGLEFGQLSSRLVQGGLSRFAARVFLPMGTTVAPRTLGPHAGHVWIDSAFEAAKRSGDLVYAVYTRAFAVSSLLMAGAPLQDVQRVAEAGVSYARGSRFPMAGEWIGVQLALVRGLRGDGVALGSLSSADVDEDRYERGLSDPPGRFYFWVRKLQARYFAGDFEGARHAARRAQELSWTSAMFVEEVELWFYGALAEAAASSPDLALIAAREQELRDWSARCPETFANKAALVAAERARLQGRFFDAEQEFELSGQLARDQRLLHEEALAHELAGRYYAGRGLLSIAQTKRRSARFCYAEWGALGKLRQLERDAGLLEGFAEFLVPGSSLGSLEQLELGVVVSALRAVSGSLEQDELIETLMRSALQQAAADRGLLVLIATEPRLLAEVASHQGAIRVQRRDVAVSASDLAEPVLRFVLRSGERVLIGDGQVPTIFADCEYLVQNPVRSLVCLPIILRGRPLGALYLENRLSSQAFGARGLAVLELIASQAAISLENARLYAEAREAKVRMTRAERISRTGSFSWRPAAQEFEWSEEMLHIYGVPETPSLDLVRERTFSADRELFEQLIADTERFTDRLIELRLQLPGGALKHIAVTVTRVAAEPAEYVGTVRDVTESKRTDEALQRTQSALADMTRIASLGEMAAAIAHEVNQPLSAIGLNASTCLRWLEDTQLNVGEAREAALRIRRDAGRAGAVVQRLRALFSKTADVRSPFELNEAVTEVVTLLRGRIRGSSTSLELQLAVELGPVLGDRVQIQQVVMNLLTNALEAMRGESVAPRQLIVRTLYGASGRIRCEIADTGKGVPEGQRRRIFEPFVSTKPDGMGIGLSICGNIVAAHEGAIGVEDNGARPGATFFFELPCAPAPPAF